MNIPAINNLNLSSVFQVKQNNNNANYSSSFGLKIAQPLAHDTVSFGANYTSAPSHTLSNYGAGISLSTAKKIHKRAEIAQEQIDKLFKKWFKDMLSTAENPNGIIEEITGRPKSPLSIREKTASPRKWNEDDENPWCLSSIKDVKKYIKDLNGKKIVLRDGSRTAVKQLLSRFSELVVHNDISIDSIKNKVPPVDSKNYAYATGEYLNKYVNSLSKYSRNPIKLKKYEITDTNYTAIHMIISIPIEIEGETILTPVEVQIMGHDMAVVKEKLDNKIFKKFENKTLSERYKPLSEILEPLRLPKELLKMDQEALMKLSDKYLIELQRPDLTEIPREELYRRIDHRKKFDQYRADVLKTQRDKEPKAYDSTTRPDMEFFLPISNDLPSKYDMNNLYRIVLQCEKGIKKNK